MFRFIRDFFRWLLAPPCTHFYGLDGVCKYCGDRIR